jgi:hypothetical protein
MPDDPIIREALKTIRDAEKLLEEYDGVQFRHTLSPPEEFRDPDLGRTKRLDREQEAGGLDAHRRAEDVERIEPRHRG